MPSQNAAKMSIFSFGDFAFGWLGTVKVNITYSRAFYTLAIPPRIWH